MDVLLGERVGAGGVSALWGHVRECQEFVEARSEQQEVPGHALGASCCSERVRPVACRCSSVTPLALVVPLVVTVIPAVLQLLLLPKSVLTTGTMSTGELPGRA